MSSSNASSLLRPAPEAWATGVIPVAHNSQARQSCALYPRQSTTVATGRRLTSCSEVSTLSRLRNATSSRIGRQSRGDHQRDDQLRVMTLVTHRRSLHVEGHADVLELLRHLLLRLPPSLLLSLRLLLLGTRGLLRRLLLKLPRLLLLQQFNNDEPVRSSQFESAVSTFLFCGFVVCSCG